MTENVPESGRARPAVEAEGQWPGSRVLQPPRSAELEASAVVCESHGHIQGSGNGTSLCRLCTASVVRSVIMSVTAARAPIRGRGPAVGGGGAGHGRRVITGSPFFA